MNVVIENIQQENLKEEKSNEERSNFLLENTNKILKENLEK